eukprot:761891-Hanusia_phi.AAC.1
MSPPRYHKRKTLHDTLVMLGQYYNVASLSSDLFGRAPFRRPGPGGSSLNSAADCCPATKCRKFGVRTLGLRSSEVCC